MKRILYTLTVAMFFATSALAQIIRVPADQPTIQGGINAAFPGDTVLVADGTYYENIDFKGKAITVASYYLFDGDTTHVDSTIIDGSRPTDPDKGSVVSFVSGEDTTSVLYGFTITGGSGTVVQSQTSRAGGGILCLSSGCKIVANKIINNSVTADICGGGGLIAVAPLFSAYSAYVVLEDNQIAHNTVTVNSQQAVGGGVWLQCNAKIIANSISYNTCIANASSIGATAGGIGCYADPPFSLEILMEKNTITHNSLRSYGNLSSSSPAFTAGAYLKGANGRMTKNEISFNEVWDYSNKGSYAIGALVVKSPDSFMIDGNSIRENAVKQGSGICYGGGLEVYGTGIMSVMNNLIAGNVATYGGGMRIDNTSMAQIINNTIINNKATYGGGISVHDATGYVMNTIVWGNQAPTHAGIHLESGGSIHVAYSDIQGGWTGTGNKNLDPKLEADSLLSGSPCIDAGIDHYDFANSVVCNVPLRDINGRQRSIGSHPDIGAWESMLTTEVVEQRSNESPNSYALHQNYPNPFSSSARSRTAGNPSTTIEFALPKASFVTLKVYNLLGKEVATLVAERRSAGAYKVNWDARGLPSGVYWYRLQVGDPSTGLPRAESRGSGQGFSLTRKLVLIR